MNLLDAIDLIGIRFDSNKDSGITKRPFFHINRNAFAKNPQANIETSNGVLLWNNWISVQSLY